MIEIQQVVGINPKQRYIVLNNQSKVYCNIDLFKTGDYCIYLPKGYEYKEELYTMLLEKEAPEDLKMKEDNILEILSGMHPETGQTFYAIDIGYILDIDIQSPPNFNKLFFTEDQYNEFETLSKNKEQTFADRSRVRHS